MSNKQNSIETIREFLTYVGYDPKTAEFLHQREDGMVSCAFKMGNLATFMDTYRGLKKAERLRSDIAVFILEAIDEKLKTYDKQ
jgi:hypothetical protein